MRCCLTTWTTTDGNIHHDAQPAPSRPHPARRRVACVGFACDIGRRATGRVARGARPGVEWTRRDFACACPASRSLAGGGPGWSGAFVAGSASRLRRACRASGFERQATAGAPRIDACLIGVGQHTQAHAAPISRGPPLTPHGAPKRSVTVPKLSAQKVCPSGMLTLSPAASASISRQGG